MNVNMLQLAIDFYNEGNSIKKTCKEFHSTPNTLKKLFKENGIKIRSQQEQLILENIKRTKQINHYFFTVLDEVNTYYLGFFAADATVRKDRNEIKIGLSSVDKDFLSELKARLDTEKEIKTYITNNGFECCELSFSSAQIKQDLAKYHIVPNKTHLGLKLDVIPEHLKMAFIKGFFDGDGSFTYNKNTKQCKVAFTSHTKDILEDIKNYFETGNIYQDKRNGIYSLEFSTYPSMMIMNKFYKIKSPYLKRKYQKYIEYLELRNNFPRDKAPQSEEEKLC